MRTQTIPTAIKDETNDYENIFFLAGVSRRRRSCRFHSLNFISVILNVTNQ